MESKSPRLWLIGESNPYGDDPEFALYPLPAHATGGRLAKVLGMDVDEYLEAFERRNLLTGSGWGVARARQAADDLLAKHPHGDWLVLLGSKVADAFGCYFRRDLCRPTFLEVGTHFQVGKHVLVIPHPSDLSRYWNQRGMAVRVRAAIEELRGHPARHEVPPR